MASKQKGEDNLLVRFAQVRRANQGLARLSIRVLLPRWVLISLVMRIVERNESVLSFGRILHPIRVAVSLRLVYSKVDEHIYLEKIGSRN